MEAAVLDLVADDISGMQKKKSVHHWGKIKTERGAKVKACKTGIYKKWKARSHSKISLKGESGDGTAQETMLAGYRQPQWSTIKLKGGKKQHSVPNAHLYSEIKDLEQVRKERQKKANTISHIRSKNSKGKKFGRNGKR
ncbi:DEAD-box ATP-dependent RNA helicase 29 [Quillaja saponaria]|uniref:DEAD-box ATP-dependent RNA helicase 29 n=1 Tax=Quillaja saponaria TaxID=32244 RepID=A0AAD7PY75_QUISA|nr:DEAD-box ATP-dependent RNA helicase 29 [Quillaja saponaria]